MQPSVGCPARTAARGETRRVRAACAVAAVWLGALPLGVRHGPRWSPDRGRIVAAAALPQPGWLADDTPPLGILYRPASAAAAAALRPRLSIVCTSMSAAFDAHLPERFSVRLYATDDAYGADHPLARRVGADWVEEHRPRREASLVVPSTADGAVDVGALEAAVRYALAHQLLAHASNGRLPGGFQEGIARLVTPPSGRTQSGVAALRAAMDRGGLIGWTELIGPGSATVRPDVGYPESLSIAVFLVRERGFACLTDVARAAAGDVPFRTAFEAACGAPFEESELAWRDWLPTYVDGGWRTHPLFSPDLGLARQLLAEGEPATVVPLLRAVVAANGDGPLASDAQSMLARAESGAASQQALTTAEAALAAGDYQAVRHAAADARTHAAPVGASGALDRAAALDDRGAEGLAAASDLERAERLPPWRLFEARRAAHRAATGYARLGNDLAAARAVTVRAVLDRRAAPVAWLAVLVGAALLGHATRRRWHGAADR